MAWSVSDYAKYIPIGGAAKKLRHWRRQGAEIIYISSHKIKGDVAKDELVLEKFRFPKGPIVFRNKNEEYKDIAEKLIPDVLIEDNCESIGGEKEMVYPNVEPGFKRRIKSIVIKEFEGIDHLPDSIKTLEARGND